MATEAAATSEPVHAEPDAFVAPAEVSTCRHCGWGIYRCSSITSDTWWHLVNAARACPAEAALPPMTDGQSVERRLEFRDHRDRSCVLVVPEGGRLFRDGDEPQIGVAHPGCDQLADISVELDAAYCPTCQYNGRISGAWVVDVIEHTVAFERDTARRRNAGLHAVTTSRRGVRATVVTSCASVAPRCAAGGARC